MLGHKSEPQVETCKSFRMLQQFYRSFMGTNCLHYAAGSSFQVCLTDSHKMSTGSRCFSYYRPLCFYAYFFLREWSFYAYTSYLHIQLRFEPLKYSFKCAQVKLFGLNESFPKFDEEICNFVASTGLTVSTSFHFYL